jgi:hypothetical protein
VWSVLALQLRPDMSLDTSERNYRKTEERRCVVRRIIMSLMLALVVAAIMGGAALAGPLVDPDTLTPSPPPGAECRDNGQYVICQTYFDEDPVVNEPAFMISCGTGDRTVYLTETIHREGTRWYNSDGLLVKRFGLEHEEGTLSLSPTGEEPTVRVFNHISWVDLLSTPGDFDSAITYRHGNDFRIVLPGGGDLLHIAGLETVLPFEDTHHGVARYTFIDEDTGFVSDPEVNTALCAALGDPITE